MLIVFIILVLTIELFVAKLFGLKIACIIMGMFNTFFVWSFYLTPIFFYVIDWYYFGKFFSVLSDIILLLLLLRKECDLKTFLLGIFFNTWWFTL